MCQKVVFPGIELRLEAPTDFRLNTHFFFDNGLTDQQLREFLSALRIGIVERSPSAEAFAALAREYDDGKLAQPGFNANQRSNEDDMVQLGMMTAKITRDSWRAARVDDECCVALARAERGSDAGIVCANDLHAFGKIVPGGEPSSYFIARGIPMGRADNENDW
jgi:hypothetical protein